MSEKFLTIKGVCELINRERWTIYRYIRTLGFPPPINPNTYPKQWAESAVRNWAKENGVSVFRGSEE
jgi:predicted DNA-binding transcriptional regulator AlpA